MRFIGRLRDECLNEHRFTGNRHAQKNHRRLEDRLQRQKTTHNALTVSHPWRLQPRPLGTIRKYRHLVGEHKRGAVDGHSFIM